MSKEKENNFFYGEILLVEDNPSDLKFITEILKKAGYSVRPASDGDLALRSLQAKPPDLILLDINLPGIGGIKICKQIKQDLKIKEIPVIFISAETETKLKVKALEAGGIDYITKPFDPSEILVRIKTHLTMHQLQQKLAVQSETLLEEIMERKHIEENLKEYQENLEQIVEERTVTLKEEIFERKEVETKLLKSEKRLKEAQKIARLGSWEWNIDSGRMIMSEEMYDIYEIKKNEDINIDLLLKLTHDEDRYIVEDAMKSTFSNTPLLPIEYRIILKDGTIKYILGMAERHLDKEGKVIKAFGVIQDISERKKIELNLRSSDEKFKVFTNQASEGITVADMDGNYIFVNPAFCKMSGYSEDELLNMTVFDMKTKEQPHSSFYDSKEKLEGVPIHVNLQRKNKTEYITEITGKVITLGKDKLVLRTIRDITERMKIEKITREQAKLLDLIFEHSLDSIVLLDKDYNFIRVSNAYANACKRDIDEFAGHNHFEFYPSSLKEEFDLIKKEKKIYMKFARPFDFPDHPEWGTTYWDLGLVPIMDIENEIELFLFTLKDVTKRILAEKDRLKLEGQLKQSQKMEAIGALAGGIAHDFNNILGVIMGYTELTLDNPEKVQEVTQNLKHVLRASDRAKDMVKQILAFSRKDDQNMSIVNIGKVIKETYAFLRSTIPTTIDINYNIENNLGLIFGNSTQINQILMNLCTNSTHAMKEEGGLLEISLKEVDFEAKDSILLDLDPGKYQQLIVSDTGHGMNKELIERIYEPYFTTKKNGEGTGMGLAVIYGIIKSHKGGIKVYSEPGKGTTFNVYFPVMENITGEKLHIDKETMIQGNKEMILFVDDEISLVELSSHLLKSLGYRVESRSSSIEALKAFKADPDKFDLIITDMTMPNMTGIKLASEIHKIKPDIPVILCTGFSNNINKNNFEVMGISELIMKPIVKQELGKAIRKILAK